MGLHIQCNLRGLRLLALNGIPAATVLIAESLPGDLEQSDVEDCAALSFGIFYNGPGVLGSPERDLQYRWNLHPWT